MTWLPSDTLRASTVWVPVADNIDRSTRLRMAANLRKLFRERRFKNLSDAAERMGISPSALGRYLKGKRTIGFDVALKVHRSLAVSLDWLVDESPEQEWFRAWGKSDLADLSDSEAPPRPSSVDDAGQRRRRGSGGR